MTRKKGERDLFGIVVQPRLAKPESPEVYAAVLQLRRLGVQVFRRGRDKHLVRRVQDRTGRAMTTPEVLQLAQLDRAALAKLMRPAR